MKTSDLLAAREPRFDSRDEGRADSLEHVRAAAWNAGHGWKLRGRDGTRRQLQPAVALELCVLQRFQCRCSAPENDRHRALPGAPDRDVPAVIVNTVLLLERRVVFLVDDQEGQPRKGREHREPRPEHQIGFSCCGCAPIARAFARRKSTVQRHGPPTGKRLRDALLELRRQVDLGNEDQRLAAGGDAVRRGRQINLGLPAARHALQQERCVASARCDDCFDCALLIGVEARLRSGCRMSDAIGVRNRSEQPRWARSDCPARTPERRHDLRKDEAQRFLIVARDKLRELEQIRGESGRVLHDFGERLQLSRIDRCRGVDGDHDAHERSPRELDPNDGADIHGEPRRNPVIECRIRGDRQRDAGDRHRIGQCIRATECLQVPGDAQVVVFETPNVHHSKKWQVIGFLMIVQVVHKPCG